MDELEISGKKYISSKRASDLTGYAKDYIGQLARNGRVTGIRIGRAWYVDEEVLRELSGTLSPVHEHQKAFFDLTKGPETTLYSIQGLISKMDPTEAFKTWEPARYFPDDSALFPEIKIAVAEREDNTDSLIQVLKIRHDERNDKKTDISSHISYDGIIARSSQTAGTMVPKKNDAPHVPARSIMILALPTTALGVLAIAGITLLLGSLLPWEVSFGPSQFAAVSLQGPAILSDNFVFYLKEVFSLGINNLSSFVHFILDFAGVFFSKGFDFIISFFHLA